MAELTYHEKQDIENTKKIRELLSELPLFVSTFFRGIEYTTSTRTRIAYALDLKTFFQFIQTRNPLYKNVKMREIKIDILNQLTSADIEEYLDHLKLYKKDEKEITNNERGVKRKLSSLRSFYGYFYKNKLITENPVLQVAIPKIHEKVITRLDYNEVAELLDNVEYGDKLTPHQLVFHEKLKKRDLALLTLLLGTGIRVSECVGLNIKDVDFDNDRIKIVRKGGYESFVYFNSEVKETLLDYLSERNGIHTKEGDENALFLSSRRQRINVRSVEILVKKYAQTVTTVKKITPHKLRSTYGTNLYKETGDIYLVADVLGHKDVNTTKKHYAAIEDERRRLAKDAVTLREKK